MSYHPDRDPLTLRMPRTMRDAVRDPNDWWEHATPGSRRFKERLVDAACWAIAFVLLAAAFTAPHWWPVAHR